jgi:hypothetical protein
MRLPGQKSQKNEGDLSNSGVLTMEDAAIALKNLNSILDRISIWLATGIYDSTYKSTKTIMAKGN